MQLTCSERSGGDEHDTQDVGAAQESLAASQLQAGARPHASERLCKRDHERGAHPRR